jgi:hypothetical protein
VVGRNNPAPVFLENSGQWPEETFLAASAGGLAILLLRDAVVIGVRGVEGQGGEVVRLALPHTSSNPIGVDPTGDQQSYFVGDEPLQWRSRVMGYAAAEYGAIAPYVDLRIEFEGGLPRLRFEMEEDADVESLELAVEGSDELCVDANGAVVVNTPDGCFHLAVSSAASELAEPGVVPAALTVIGQRIVLRSVGDDACLPAVIEVGLEWSGFVGGSSIDQATHVVVAPNGDILIAGTTASLDFPTTPGALDSSYADSQDLFISRFDSTGSELLASTYLGGVGQEFCGGLAVGTDGAVTMAGYTSSTDFPTTAGAYDQAIGGSNDLYVARLSADLQSLVWATYIGGDNPTVIGETSNRLGMALGFDDSVYVLGRTRDSSFPVTPSAYDTVPEAPLQGVGEAVVSHASADGSQLLHSTFLGGSADEQPRAIAVMSDGVVVAGQTTSLDFPVSPNAFDPEPPGQFVAKLDLQLSSLVFSTILSAHQVGPGATLQAVAGGLDGSVTVTGYTNASQWPTTPGAFDTTFGGGSGEDVFVTRLNATGTELVYSTFIGGPDREGGAAVVVDTAGVATVAGFTQAASGASFPISAGAWDSTGNGGYDAFAARLSPDGSKLWYASFLGGSSSDSELAVATAIAETLESSVVIASTTFSADYPVTDDAFDTTLGGQRDGYVAKLSMLPSGVARYGTSTAGCAGYLAMGVTAMPQVGKSFAMTCRNAPPSVAGTLILGLSDLSQPLMAKGAEFWINPMPVMLGLPMASNPSGFAMLGGTLPNAPSLVGATFTVQSFWPDPCAPSGPISASNALAITIQP